MTSRSSNLAPSQSDRATGSPDLAARRHGTEQRGTVLVLFVLAATVLFLITGMVVDLGIAYVTRSTLSKAVDAAALAGARHSAKGKSKMEQLIRQVAEANYGVATSKGYGTNYTVQITARGNDVTTVAVTGSTQSPTYFSAMLGKKDIAILSEAEATRYPLDMSLVLDLSYSLERNGAFDDMQQAALAFLDNFDESVDKVGLVTYSTWAEEHMPLSSFFHAESTKKITGLAAISDTNIDEGLRFAKRQMDAGNSRSSALKVIVLFTDGRPTAFGHNVWLDGNSDSCSASSCTDQTDRNACNGGKQVDSDKNGIPDCFPGVIATYISGSSYRGLFDLDSGAKIIGFSKSGNPTTTSNGSSTNSPSPKRLPDGSKVNGDNIRRVGAEQAEWWADQIRSAGYTIYTVGLGNPNATDAGDRPDLDFLARIANDHGIVSRMQPHGELMFAPTPADLEAAFAKVADRILTRLTR